MRLIRMIPDPVSQPEMFDPGYPKEWMDRDVARMGMDNPWLGLCNLAQCVFLHGGEQVSGATMTLVTEMGTVTFDSLDLASWWLMCADGMGPDGWSLSPETGEKTEESAGQKQKESK